MERTTPVRKPHTSTSDLLAWPEGPFAHSSSTNSASSASRPALRSHQPSDGISKVLCGGQISDEEAESLMKRKPCSGYKLKEMNGSGIFTDDGESSAQEAGSSNHATNKTGLRIYQQALGGISQISFAPEESVSPKKPTSLPEVAKQRELSGTLKSDSDAKIQKQLSDAKCKELGGHDIFGPPPEIPPKPLAARNLELKGSIDFGEPLPRSLPTSIKVSNSNIMFSKETPIKTAKKIPDQKFQELTGNDIFKGDGPSGSAEKPLSAAKRREMSGSDIFADGKAASRDYLGGVRKPPGGESSIALV